MEVVQSYSVHDMIEVLCWKEMGLVDEVVEQNYAIRRH